MNNKWFAIVNPYSGNGKTQKNWPLILKTLKKNNIDIEYSFTSGQGRGIDITRQVLDSGYKKVIAVGGDGTINEVLNGLMFEGEEKLEGIEMAILDNGTGSDFVRTINQKSGISEFLKVLQGNKSIMVDVGSVDFEGFDGTKKKRYFLNAANIGIGAETVNRVNQGSKALGSKVTYFTGTVMTFLKYRNTDIACQINGREINGPLCGLVICNGRYMGGGMQIAPQAQINDGYFDVVVLEDINKLKFLTLLPLIYSGKHTVIKNISMYRCKSLSLKSKDPLLLETDGEVPGIIPSTFEIIPQCLNLRI